jgi:hypothetical protein
LHRRTFAAVLLQRLYKLCDRGETCFRRRHLSPSAKATRTRSGGEALLLLTVLSAPFSGVHRGIVGEMVWCCLFAVHDPLTMHQITGAFLFGLAFVPFIFVSGETRNKDSGRTRGLNLCRNAQSINTPGLQFTNPVLSEK